MATDIKAKQVFHGAECLTFGCAKGTEIVLASQYVCGRAHARFV
jgi:hypothetical protein